MPDAPPTRRTFIRSTAMAALASGVPTISGQKLGGDIDAHVHVWTPDKVNYPWAPGATAKYLVTPSFTPEELFAHCRPQGVERVVLIQMSFYGYDNRYMLDAIAKYPRAFVGVAIVDEKLPDVRATMQQIAKRGVRGFRLMATQANAEGWGAHAGIQAMWAQGAEAGLAMCLLADPGALPAIHRMCAQHPQTRVVIDHLARIGMDGQIRQADIDRLCGLAAFEHTYVKTSAFYALGAKKAPYTDLGPMIRQLRDAFGASRLMWASDSPFAVNTGHVYADSIALIRDRIDFLSLDDKAWMLRKTAEGLFFS